MENLGFYKQAQWQAICNRVKAKELSIDALIISMYMEDKAGKPISASIKNTLCGDLFAYWTQVQRSGEELANFTDLGLERKDHFCKTFEVKYPWLRLCEVHWKVDHLWINYFGSWKKTRTTLDPKLPKLSPDLSPIDVSSSTEASSNAATIGSKRGREEPNSDAPSKCHKGKDRDIFTAPTKFHSSCPLPKKKFIVKVSKHNLFSLYPC